MLMVLAGLNSKPLRAATAMQLFGHQVIGVKRASASHDKDFASASFRLR
jgi:hypothetical protein